MANSLLDFVMSLVRDPDAAARYAENPDQAIADANLIDVTSADVNNLIPVVSESLSTAVPSTGSDALIGDAGRQRVGQWRGHRRVRCVRRSMCRRSDRRRALDGRPISSVSPTPPLQPGLDVLADAGVPGVAGVDDPSLQFDGPVIDDVPVHELAVDDDWSHSVAEVTTWTPIAPGSTSSIVAANRECAARRAAHFRALDLQKCRSTPDLDRVPPTTP